MEYSDSSIRVWAGLIRQQKILDLQKMIVTSQRALKNTDFKKEDYMSLRRVQLLNDIYRLSRKLEILKK